MSCPLPSAEIASCDCPSLFTLATRHAYVLGGLDCSARGRTRHRAVKPKNFTCRRVKAETDSDGAVWTDSAPSCETAVSYETEEKKKGQKRKPTEASTHKDGKIKQTGLSSIQFQACEASIMDSASFYECCNGVALTPISPLAQSDMIWVSLVFTVFPFRCMEQVQVRLSASIYATMNAW